MKGFIAILAAISLTACFIAVIHYTSFERHHTHDWPHEQNNHSQNATHKNNVSDNSAVAPLNGNEAIDSTKTRQSNPAYTDGESLQHDDHKAQISMAVFTFVGLVIGGAGLFMIWRTLIYTGEAKDLASETLAEAKNATEITRDIGEKQVKAYVAFESGYWMLEGIVMVMCLRLKNYGQSPCVRGSVRSVAQLNNYGVYKRDGKIVLGEPKAGRSDTGTRDFDVIDCGGTTECTVTWLTSDIADKFYGEGVEPQFEWLDESADPKITVDFHVAVEWEDVFGKTSKIVFRCSNDDENNDRSPVENWPRINRFENLKIYRTISRD